MLPALAVTLAATTIAELILDRDHLRSYLGDPRGGRHLVPPTGGTSWHQRSISRASGARRPIRHPWSLAIEEQFYLPGPLIVAVVLASAATVAARRRRLLAVALLLGCRVGIWSWPGQPTPPAH